MRLLVEIGVTVGWWAFKWGLLLGALLIGGAGLVVVGILAVVGAL